ncbi:MAG: SMI1/KNR4 family protein [Verrucomicrobiota bacterium]|jgi:hypothetical protein
MAVQIVKPNKVVDSAVIREFEAVIGAKLPGDYQMFLLTFNGGKPESNEFPIPDQQNAAGVDLFYGLLEKSKWGDLLSRRTALTDRVPKDVLPIGDASCGNIVCLSLQPKTFGQIFFWDHELEAEEDEPATFSNLFKIGDSFTNFLENLKKFDASQVQLKPGQVKRVWGNPDFKPEF